MLYPLSYGGLGPASYCPPAWWANPTSLRPMSLTVLVVEDDPVIQDLLDVNFSMEGYDVLRADDGAIGVKMATEHLPDVIVMDIMMPNKSGLEAVAEMKGNPDTADIPVILLSAKAQETDRNAGLEAGADDYITKPFEPQDLIDRVARLAESRRR